MSRGPRTMSALLALCGAVLCEAHPLQQYQAPPPMDPAALGPAILAALSLITVVVFLAGCVCCRRNKFTGENDDMQFTNALGNDLSEIVGSASARAVAVPAASSDTGIVNPITDREFTIFAPLSPENYPRPRDNVGLSPEHARIAQLQFYGPIDIENNNPTFENNNNGPISPQELENIVNNNAENYIVSEYENRNLNLIPPNENIPLEEPQTSREFRSTYQEIPPLVQDNGLGRLEEHRDWFENPDNYFPRNQLQYLQEIGKGWFGRIVEADAHNLNLAINSTNDQETKSDASTFKSINKVAIKILDENVSVGEKCIFLEECQLYKNANDKNILRLLDFNLEQDPWLIIFEYCSLGDLKTFLKSNTTSIPLLTDKGIPLKFQCEVASALSYLHSQNVVHTDIACHSCMVTENWTVKLGDYGGTSERHPSDFYYVFDKPLPIRWLAPECWMQKPTQYSNMWSFGIFLWESSSWGSLPYENLSNEQIISSVLIPNGVRLNQPVSSSVFGSYLYQIMQSCWQENPSDRITAVQTLALLNYIFSNCFETADSENVNNSLVHSFEQRWQNMKPNTIPKVDNTKNGDYQIPLAVNSQVYEDSASKFDGDSICPAPSECSSAPSNDVVLDDFSEKTKSDSLTNLHGSLESIQDRNNTESEQYSNKESEISFTGSVKKTPLHNIVSSLGSNNCEVAPWLQDLPVTSQEDMSYIKTVSDVISDLDNMLSSEKTSSSESSHQTSPSRDLSNNTVSSNKNVSIDTLCSIKKELEEEDIKIRCDYNKEKLVPNTEIGSSSGDEVLLKPHQSNVNENENQQECYPTLDFRLVKIENKPNDVYPIFQTKYISSSQEFDSLQDSSYIPENLKKDSNDSAQKYSRQYSSGSETEDEIWKKRIEMGAISEKIKSKSKSVTDFMVLTHIDMDFTDLESEDASITSVDGKSAPITFDRCRKRHKYDSPVNDSSLPADELVSFARNFSFTNTFRNENIIFPEIDMHKLKKNLRNLTLRSIRPTKSFDDLHTLQNRPVALKDLLNFKNGFDSFLDNKLNLNKNDSTTVSKGSDLQISQESTKYLNLPDLTSNFNEKQDSSIPESMKFACEAESASNKQMEINTSTPKNINTNDDFDNMTKMEKSLIENIKKIDIVEKTDNIAETNKPSFDRTFTVKKLEQIAVDKNDLESKLKKSPVHSNPESNVSLGPFSDCTLDLYTGLKTDFKDCDMAVSEEEALMFSSNFNCNENANEINEPRVSSPVQNNYFDVSSAYFFNSSAVNQPSSDVEKELNYSIDTWDRFLGSSFDTDCAQNFDNIFPDTDKKLELSSDSRKLKNIPADDGNRQSENTSFRTSSNLPTCSFQTDYETCQKEFNSLTSKLAIAENENNLNLELSIPQDTLENDVTSSLNIDYHNPNSSSLYGNIENSGITNYDCVENPEVTSEQHIDNLDETNHPNEGELSKPAPHGWFLHEKKTNTIDDLESDSSLDTYDTENCEGIVKKSSRRKNINPNLDPESVEALRTELELKLPLAQMINQCMQDSDINNPSADFNISESAAIENISTEDQSLDENAKSNTNESVADAETQVSRNEVLIHYKIPLSPIQEESWSESFEIAKMGEFDKSDTSNSLSLGQLNSMIIGEEIMIDKISDAILMNEEIFNDDKLKGNSDDDANDDSHDSNRTFVILDGYEMTKINGGLSVSADSLNCIDDQIDMDCETEVNNANMNKQSNSKFPNSGIQTTDMLSPFYEDHSTTKSTEEISQNVDNLLENISKTLESASKVISVSSDHMPSLDHIAEDFSDASLNDNSANSKTYVIETKDKIADDITYTCPKKVIEVPDDVSNVSKISQPSLVSDTANITESQMKPSDKSISQNLHTQTPSIDSWCSNDTLYNVEENFDDVLSLNDFIGSNAPTPTNDDSENQKWENNAPLLETCSKTASEKYLIKLPSIEMVMNYPANIEEINPPFSNLEIDYSLQNETPTTTREDSPDKFSCQPLSSVNTNSEGSKGSNSNLINQSEDTISKQINTVIRKLEGKMDNPEIVNDLQDIQQHVEQDGITDIDNAVDLDDIKLDIINEVTSTPKTNDSCASTSANNCVPSTSTPVLNLETQTLHSKQSNMSQESIVSAQSLIDAQFNFLDDIVAPNLSVDEETNCFDFGSDFPQDECDNSYANGEAKESISRMDPSIVNFVSVEQKPMDYSNLHNITLDFLNTEKGFITTDKMCFKDENKNNPSISYKMATGKDSLDNLSNLHSDKIDDISQILIEDCTSDSVSANLSNELGVSNSVKDSSGNLLFLQSGRINDISPISFEDCTSGSKKINLSIEKCEVLNDENSLNSISYDDFQKSAGNRDQDTSENNPVLDYDSNYNGNSSKIPYNDCDSNLAEYLSHSGLNLKSLEANSELSLGSPIKNSTLSSDIVIDSTPPCIGGLKGLNLFNSELSNIHFSGPVDESLFSNTNSFSCEVKNFDDINTMAPECLNDWDSGSDDSNANSSSSGEFTWKKGDSEEPITLSASIQLSPNSTKNKKISTNTSNYDVIVEETNNSDSSDCSSDEEIEFTPSTWDCSATPGKSSLKSSETIQSEPKKRVVFKKQRHTCIYEYPREVSDNEGDSPNLYYSDWQDICNSSDTDMQFVKYDDLCTSEIDGLYTSSDIPRAGEEFFVSTSTSFEPYNFTNSSSQFFPGQHLSLLKSSDADIKYEIDDDEPLPPIPTELLLVKSNNKDEDPNNVITTILENIKSSDFITPDSGTEDVTPGSLLEYEIKGTNDLKNNLNNQDKENMNSIMSTNHELLLNLANKNRSNTKCGALILPDKSSPCGSITPSTPSPSPSGNSTQSSGSTSPLAPPSTLGGLRHTRDKLKLDLPPSPLARNSPSAINSGKNFNHETKIFDFKNIDSLDIHDKPAKHIPHINDSPIDSPPTPNEQKQQSNQLIKENLPKTIYTESPDSTSSIDKLEDVFDSKMDDNNSHKWLSGTEPRHLDGTVLQKAVIPIHVGDHPKKSILEPVKGEGTLLDSGDEDSGIGSSAYTTLERKIDVNIKVKTELSER